ncbi:MAG: sigma-54-dependent Fis family transcriptional regulator [Nitrospirae bacterium]|nr:sigma-54-dependent Fis family transcriptional regulator [Nitrospirota bacterium]
MEKAKILVVDDEHLIRWTLEQHLGKEGYEVHTAESGEKALAMVSEISPHLMLLDNQLPGMSGIEVLGKVKEMDKDVIVIMITAHGLLETAVKAMKLGAYDYLSKPFNLDEITISIKKALDTVSMREELRFLKEQQKSHFKSSNIIGKSRAIQHVLEMINKIAQSDASTVLIQGESGTGKELVAKAVHMNSARSDKPFMAINCAALPENLLESELLGHEKGAFTDAKTLKKGLLELADGGSVFLDEVGDMAYAMQAKLLRILEDRTFKRVGGVKDISVDVRIISATNQDLKKLMDEGGFRKDLYYRLQVVPIYLPPLRERKEDVLPLAKYFIEQFNGEFHKDVKEISEKAREFLVRYDWPGNVRELKNVIERAMILESEDILLLEHLPIELVSGNLPPAPSAAATGFNIPKEGLSLDKVEEELVRQALAIAAGNQSKAADLLGVQRDAFRRRMKKYGLM